MDTFLVSYISSFLRLLTPLVAALIPDQQINYKFKTNVPPIEDISMYQCARKALATRKKGFPKLYFLWVTGLDCREVLLRIISLYHCFNILQSCYLKLLATALNVCNPYVIKTR